jgi:mono/diheme cytochrome c family protein
MALPNEPMILLSPESASLLEFLLASANFTLLAFVGSVVCGAAVAFLLPAYGGRRFQPFGLDLLSKIPVNLPVAILVVLIAAVSLFCARLLYDPGLLTAAFWSVILFILFFGVAVLALARRLALTRGMISPGHALLASAGILTALASLFILVSAAALLIMPEEWPFVAGNRGLILSWNGVAKFLEFAALSLAVAGAGILGIGSRLEKGELQDSGISPLALKTGTIMASAALLIWPVPLLFGLVTLPAQALSPSVFILAGAGLFLALIASLQLLASPGEEKSRRATPVLIAILILFSIHVLTDHWARGNVLIEPVLLARALSVTPALAVEKPVPEAAVEEEEPVSAGKEVFERHCTPCHRFDRRLVGPPLNEVVPKYRGDIETLKNFIGNPVKKNPDYPAMPKLALTEEEIAAVAAYLLEQTAPESGG